MVYTDSSAFGYEMYHKYGLSTMFSDISCETHNHVVVNHVPCMEITRMSLRSSVTMCTCTLWYSSHTWSVQHYTSRAGSTGGQPLECKNKMLCNIRSIVKGIPNATIFCVYFTFADYVSGYSIANKRWQQFKYSIYGSGDEQK